MIFHWINSIARWFRWFFLPPEPPPEGSYLPIIALDAQCPWCGHRNSFIKASPKIEGMAGMHNKVIRHCNVCNGESSERPSIEGGGKFLPEQVASVPPMN